MIFNGAKSGANTEVQKIRHLFEEKNPTRSFILQIRFSCKKVGQNVSI
jgi:hypothetical protein